MHACVEGCVWYVCICRQGKVRAKRDRLFRFWDRRCISHLSDFVVSHPFAQCVLSYPLPPVLAGN